LQSAPESYLRRADGIGCRDDASDTRVDDGDGVVLNVGRLLNILLYLADPPLFQLLQILSTLHADGLC